MKKELKSYKKLSFFFSFVVHTIILVLLIEVNKKKLLPNTSMIEVELRSSYQKTKQIPKITNSEPIDRNIALKKQTSSIYNKTNKNLESKTGVVQIDLSSQNSIKLNEDSFNNKKPEKKI